MRERERERERERQRERERERGKVQEKRILREMGYTCAFF